LGDARPAVNLLVRQLSIEKMGETVTAARADFAAMNQGQIVALSNGSIRRSLTTGDARTPPD
jgi:hypothetical protein